jgi:hypothetical protein
MASYSGIRSQVRQQYNVDHSSPATCFVGLAKYVQVVRAVPITRERERKRELYTVVVPSAELVSAEGWVPYCTIDTLVGPTQTVHMLWMWCVCVCTHSVGKYHYTNNARSGDTYDQCSKLQPFGLVVKWQQCAPAQECREPHNTRQCTWTAQHMRPWHCIAHSM